MHSSEFHRNVAMNNTFKINKYLPAALIYFFFNSLFLPEGLLYTTILTPVFFVWLYEEKMLTPLVWFFFLTILYACIHFIIGVNILFYLKSYLLFTTVFIFVIAFFLYVRKTSTLRHIFRSILILNFLLLMIACAAYFMPAVRPVFWMQTDVSQGLEDFPRLKMFTYEASYYSLLFVPIAIYYLLKILLFRFPNSLLVTLMVILPLALSFAFGVLLGIPLALLLLFISDVRLFYVKSRMRLYILSGLIVLVIVSLFFSVIYPDNPLFVRLVNLFEGRDSSFKGRVFDSIYLAFKAANEKSLLFGAGLGQFKLVAKDFYNQFYHVTDIETVRLPNSVCDTIASFGVSGLLIRLGAQIYLFFKTRVYANYYQLGMFIFVFIYQFTGSFLTNIAEYVIWVLAFIPVFDEFDKNNIHQNKVS